MLNYILFLPISYNFIIMMLNNNRKNKHLVLEMYNMQKKIKIPVPKGNNYIDINTNCICFNNEIVKNNVQNILTKISRLLFILTNTFFNKIKFKGKGFRVRFKKKTKILKFTFGHSHINYVFINDKKLKIKRLGKYKYIIKSKQILQMNILLKNICSIKPTNMYTKRGIRLSRQVVYKRKGKKSTYV